MNDIYHQVRWTCTCGHPPVTWYDAGEGGVSVCPCGTELHIEITEKPSTEKLLEKALADLERALNVLAKVRYKALALEQTTHNAGHFYANTITKDIILLVGDK